jgi:hypothetical protein
VIDFKKALIGLAAALAAAWSCGSTAEREARRLQARTIPPSANLLAVAGPAADGSGLAFNWELEIHEGWRAYADRMRREFAADFEVLAASPRGVTLRRTRPADVHDLKVRVLRGGLPAHVRVTFVAQPW